MVVYLFHDNGVNKYQSYMTVNPILLHSGSKICCFHSHFLNLFFVCEDSAWLFVYLIFTTKANDL